MADMADRKETKGDLPTPDWGRWSFDFIKYRDHVKGMDDFQVILRGHLYLEHVMIMFLREALPRPDQLDIKRLSYSTKVRLCAALGILQPELLGPMNKFNEFRNGVAHNLDHLVSVQEKLDFFNLFSERGKALILEHGTKKGVAKTPQEIPLDMMLTVLVVLLEIGRQRYVDWKKDRNQWREKATALLKEYYGEDREKEQ